MCIVYLDIFTFSGLGLHGKTQGFWHVTTWSFLYWATKASLPTAHCIKLASDEVWKMMNSCLAKYVFILKHNCCVVCVCMQWSHRQEGMCCGCTIIHFIQGFICYLHCYCTTFPSCLSVVTPLFVTWFLFNCLNIWWWWRWQCCWLWWWWWWWWWL